MLKNVLLKSLYEKRWAFLGWSVAIIAMTMLSTMLFPTFRDSIGASLAEVPESMRAFFGDASTYQSLGGFVDVQVVAQMVFLTIIMGVIMGSGYIAGEEGDGTLQSLLAQPIKRSSVFIQKYIALALLTFVAAFLIFIAVFVSGLLINESMDWWRMLQATFGIWLITFVFSASAFAIGAVTGKRGISGSIVGMLAFVTYIITSLAAGVSVLKTVDIFSPFHYFNTPSIITYGIDWGNVAVLIAIIIAVTALGYTRFMKRDIR